MSNIEKGINYPRIEIVLLLARNFAVNPAWLLAGRGDMRFEEGPLGIAEAGEEYQAGNLALNLKRLRAIIRDMETAASRETRERGKDGR